MQRYVTLGFAVLLYTLGSNAALAFGITGVDLKFISDSNPAKAELTQDIESTSALQGRVALSIFSKELVNTATRGSGISLSGSASFENNNGIEELGESRYRIGFGWFNEFKTRGAQPFISFGAGVGFLDSETFIRDGVILDVIGSVNLQPTAFFDTTLGVRAEMRDAETEVFDSTKTTFFLTTNFSPISRLVFRSGLRFVIGNEISTATPTLNIINNANAIEADPAFGGLAENRFAYLIDANSFIAELGMGFEVSKSTQANLLYRFVSTDAEGDIGYDRQLIELTLSLSL